MIPNEINIKKNVFNGERRDIFNPKRVTPGEDSQRMITLLLESFLQTSLCP
jgi:hypothetical protein